MASKNASQEEEEYERLRLQVLLRDGLRRRRKAAYRKQKQEQKAKAAAEAVAWKQDPTLSSVTSQQLQPKTRIGAEALTRWQRVTSPDGTS